MSQTQKKRRPFPRKVKGDGSGPVFEIRTAANMTQAAFATATGVSARTIATAEREGMFPPSPLAMNAITRFAREKGIDYTAIIG